MQNSVIGDIVPTDQESENTLGLNQTLSFKLNFLDTGDFLVTSIFDTDIKRWVGRLSLNKNSLDFERKRFYLVEVNVQDDGLIGVLQDATNATGGIIYNADGTTVREKLRVRMISIL